MDDLVINRQLATAVIDNQDTDAASPIGKGVVKSRPESILINDRKTLLDLARLSHRDNTTIITDIQDAVLLEDRAEHVLHDHRRLGVGHEAGLFMKLLGEEVDSEVAVLARLSRSGDANDLARTTLEDEQITDADVVARNRDGIGSNTALDEADALTDTFADAGWAAVFLAVYDDFFTVGVVMTMAEWMHDTVGGAFDAATEGVVVTFVVVVTHVSLGGVDGCFGFEFHLFSWTAADTVVFDVVGGLEALTVVAFGGVDSCSSTVDFYVNLVFWGSLVRFSVSATC